MPFFYIVATPIGNLKDITFRAIDALKEVDLILCEDTRESKKLLDFYNIKKPLLSFNEHSDSRKEDDILEFLRQGKNLALVCDAGTPGISDPGGKIISRISKDLDLREVKIIPVPGSSALTSAISVSGFPTDKFLFLGFPPAKNKRDKFFNELSLSPYPVVIYESPHRILKTLTQIKEKCAGAEIVLCRELTKKFETILRGSISEIEEKIKNGEKRGEFVLVINNNSSIPLIQEFKYIAEVIAEAGSNKETIMIYYPKTDDTAEGWREVEPYSFATDIAPEGEHLVYGKDRIVQGHIFNGFTIGSQSNHCNSFILGKIRAVELTGKKFNPRNKWQVEF